MVAAVVDVLLQSYSFHSGSMETLPNSGRVGGCSRWTSTVVSLAEVDGLLLPGGTYPDVRMH